MNINKPEALIGKINISKLPKWRIRYMLSIAGKIILIRNKKMYLNKMWGASMQREFHRLPIRISQYKNEKKRAFYFNKYSKINGDQCFPCTNNK